MIQPFTLLDSSGGTGASVQIMSSAIQPFVLLRRYVTTEDQEGETANLAGGARNNTVIDGAGNAHRSASAAGMVDQWRSIRLAASANWDWSSCQYSRSGQFDLWLGVR